MKSVDELIISMPGQGRQEDCLWHEISNLVDALLSTNLSQDCDDVMPSAKGLLLP